MGKLVKMLKKDDFNQQTTCEAPVFWSKSTTSRVRTGLAVYLAELEEKNLFRTIGQFLGPITKR